MIKTMGVCYRYGREVLGWNKDFMKLSSPYRMGWGSGCLGSQFGALPL